MIRCASQQPEQDGLALVIRVVSESYIYLFFRNALVLYLLGYFIEYFISKLPAGFLCGDPQLFCQGLAVRFEHAAFEAHPVADPRDIVSLRICFGSELVIDMHRNKGQIIRIREPVQRMQQT